MIWEFNSFSSYKQYKGLFFSFIKVYLTNKVVEYLKCTTWWFDSCIHCEKIPTMELINISITLHIYLPPLKLLILSLAAWGPHGHSNPKLIFLEGGFWKIQESVEPLEWVYLVQIFHFFLTSTYLKKTSP